MNGVDDDGVDTTVTELFIRLNDSVLPETIDSFRVSWIVGAVPSYVNGDEGKDFRVCETVALLIFLDKVSEFDV